MKNQVKKVKDYHKYVNYIAFVGGGSVSKENFREDFEPIGGLIMCEMEAEGIIKSNDVNLWLV